MNHLRRLRVEKGMTQVELSRRIKIASSAISAVENGDRRAWPNFRKRVARALGVKESELFPNG